MRISFCKPAPIEKYNRNLHYLAAACMVCIHKLMRTDVQTNGAGKAHDVMALKCRGPGSPLNFGLEEYEELLPMLPNLSKVRSEICQLLTCVCQFYHGCLCTVGCCRHDTELLCTSALQPASIACMPQN